MRTKEITGENIKLYRSESIKDWFDRIIKLIRFRASNWFCANWKLNSSILNPRVHLFSFNSYFLIHSNGLKFDCFGNYLKGISPTHIRFQ